MPTTDNRKYRIPSSGSTPDLAAHLTALGRDVDQDVEAQVQALASASRNASADTTAALADAKEFTSTEVAKDRTRLTRLEGTTVPAALADAKEHADAKDTANRKAWATADAAALADAKEHTSTEVTKDRTRLTTLEGTTVPKVLADAKEYADTKDAAQQKALDKLSAESWLKPLPGGTVDMDDFDTSGYVGVISSLSENLPIQAQGVLEVFKFGSALTQRFTTYVVRVRVFVRHRNGAEVWNEWVEPGRSPVMLGSSADLNTTTAPGSYDISSGNVANHPLPGSIGSLEVLQVVRAVIQRFTSWSVGEPRVFIRSSQIDQTSWRDWYEIPGSTVFTAMKADVTAITADLWTVKSRTGGNGYKRAHLALNQPSGSSTEAVAAASVRWPVTLGVTAQRARLHVRNWNWSVGSTADYEFTYKGAVSFTGLWVGRGDGKTFTGPPVRALAPFTTDANGGEYVSPWFAYEFTEDIQHLVSVGFTTADGQTNYMGRGGCWRNTTPADASALDPAAELSATSPFDVWLELEVPAATPVLAGFGDSNTVGTGTTLPVHDSWLAQYCRRNRALPLFLANHGSAASSWAGPEARKWNRFRDVAQADAAVYFLHQNDLKEGVTLAELQQKFRDTLAILKQRITPNVYGATITPSGNKPEAVNTVRKQFNTWLRGRPEGLVDCFDFSAALSDDDLKLRPADNFDGLHFNTGGHAKLAAALDARPVTPRILTRGEIESLLAGRNN